LLAEFAAADFDLPMDPIWVLGMALYADAAITAEDTRYAAELFSRLEPWADQWSSSGSNAYAPFSFYLGGLAALLQRYGEAEAYFESAARVSERVGAKFVQARTDLLWGKMLAEREDLGDCERARDLLAKAHTLAISCGYSNVERRANDAVNVLGP
jgi:hypothetical protein